MSFGEIKGCTSAPDGPFSALGRRARPGVKKRRATQRRQAAAAPLPNRPPPRGPAGAPSPAS
eukprot:7190974-Alexandrium_andersonii.AAC.1